MSAPAPEYVHARRALLDALDHLGAHRAAAILVGAQAVYARSTDVPIASSPYTTDADIALDPRLLGLDPALEAAMTAAGFALHGQPGLWFKPDDLLDEAEVDLLVPAALSGPGKRGARLKGHSSSAAMKSPGLEPALYDHSPMTIASFEGDGRSHTIEVAGVAALLIAKAHKVGERLDEAASGKTDRTNDKDAADIVRLLLVADGATRSTLTSLADIEIAAPSTIRGIAYLRSLFGGSRSVGVEMAALALRNDMPVERVAAVAVEQVRMLTDGMLGG